MMNIKSTILGSVVAAMALIASAGPAAADGYGRGWVRPSRLEGTWAVVIHPYVCTTGVSLPTTIKAIHTFTAGGTMVESTAGNTFQPGQRAPGLGFWERTGQRILPGSLRGVRAVRQPGCGLHAAVQERHATLRPGDRNAGRRSLDQ